MSGSQRVKEILLEYLMERQFDDSEHIQTFDPILRCRLNCLPGIHYYVLAVANKCPSNRIYFLKGAEDVEKERPVDSNEFGIHNILVFSINFCVELWTIDWLNK